MKKRKKQIYLSNLWLYMFIIIGILVIIGTGVYAATYASSGGGHPYTEISTCGANQVLKMNSAGTAWTCQSDAVGTGGGITVETDPTVEVSVKDGVTWYEITDRPYGVDDGDQLGITSVTIDTERVSCVIPPSELSYGHWCDALCPYGTMVTGCGTSTEGLITESMGVLAYRDESIRDRCACSAGVSGRNGLSESITCYAICLRVTAPYS